jgi:hypothetical protein
MKKKFLGPVLILGLLFLSACGAKKSSFKIGETTRADVIALKGEPLSEEAVPIPDGKIMRYQDDEKIQLKGEMVTNRFTNPKGDEKLVMWWKHKFKECTGLKLVKLAPDVKSHLPPEIEMACPEEGISVIFTEGSDTISRVVEYEKK